MEDNFKHRQDLVKPDENLSNSNKEYLSEDDRPNKHSGIGPRTKDGKHGVLLIFSSIVVHVILETKVLVLLNKYRN